MALIQTSSCFRGYPPLEATDALNQARIWDGFGLQVIPEDDLPHAFTRALEALGEGESFGAPNVLKGWHTLKRERYEARASQKQQRYLQAEQPPSISFAQWWAGDTDWISANLPPETQAKMQEIFDKRMGAKT